MENNLENKAKFFAQHWGQTIASSENGSTYSVEFILGGNALDRHYLELPAYTSITEEHLAELGIKYRTDYCATGSDEQLKEWGHNEEEIRQIHIRNGNRIMNSHFRKANVMDFLRLKGYAVPFHELDVEDLINYGWLKLKTQ